MTLSVAVMAHQSRHQQVDELTAALDSEVWVSWDTQPASKNPQQRWATARQAWLLAAAADADWCLVLQDDALVCDDFVAGAMTALWNVPQPDAVVSFYLGSGRPHIHHCQRVVRMARKAHVSWASMQFLYWGVAVALPTTAVQSMIDWGNDPRRAKMPYDGRIARWARDTMQWPCWYTVPSLVDHRDEGSLVGHDVPGRRALDFHAGSALAVDWSRRPAGDMLKIRR